MARKRTPKDSIPSETPAPAPSEPEQPAAALHARQAERRDSCCLQHVCNNFHQRHLPKSCKSGPSHSAKTSHLLQLFYSTDRMGAT